MRAPKRTDTLTHPIYFHTHLRIIIPKYVHPEAEKLIETLLQHYLEKKTLDGYYDFYIIQKKLASTGKSQFHCLRECRRNRAILVAARL